MLRPVPVVRAWLGLGVALAVPLAFWVGVLFADQLWWLFHWVFFLGPASWVLLLSGTLPAICRRENPFGASTERQYA
jgi:hypothetical protein